MQTINKAGRTEAVVTGFLIKMPVTPLPENIRRLNSFEVQAYDEPTNLFASSSYWFKAWHGLP